MRSRHVAPYPALPGFVDRLSEVVIGLPRTSEQHEQSSREIPEENRDRLQVLAAALGSAPPGPVLDVGFGYGYSAAAIRAALPQAPVVAVDRPRPVVSSSEWQRLVAYLHVTPVLADATSLPFVRRRFAAVVAGELIEHLPTECVPAFLREAVACLMPGGVLAITTPNLVALRNRILVAAGRSPFDLPLPEEQFRGTFGHLREYLAGEVEDLLRSAGLVGVTCVTVGLKILGGFLVAWGVRP